MKLRQAHLHRGGHQQLRNLKDLKESNRDSKHESFKENAGPTRSGINSEVLSDSDSSQSDEDVLDLSVVNRTENHESGIKDVKNQLPGTGEGDALNLLSKENETQKFVGSQGNSPETSQKISLVPDSMAEDTVGELGLSYTTDLEKRSPDESPAESIEESESSFDFSVRSGPSSPNVAVNPARCRECESLFTKMRRQPPPKTKNSNSNPASLSCDEWVLLKKWYPQRGRRTEKRSQSWQHKSPKTELRASAPDLMCFSTGICVVASIQTDPSFTTAKPRHRRRQRPALWPPIGGHKPVKRKSSLNKTLSQQISSSKLGISSTQKIKPLVADEFSGLDASSSQNSSVSPKQKRKDVQERSEQEVCGGVEATRRALTFEDTPKIVAVETAKRIRGPWRRLETGEIHEDQKVVETKDLNGLQETFEDTDGFKTPTDLFIVKRKIKRGSKEVQTSKPTVQTTSFMSVLATAVRNHNKITKETCQ